VASNITWTLPNADGTSGQVLSTNGSGTLSWATGGGGGGSSISAGNSDVTVTDTGTGKIEFNVDAVEVADFTTGAVVFNETGANQDFRVEGDTNANLIFADASVDKVGFGTNTFNTNGGVIQVSNGISFPATQSACSDVNTLDDYEEGTFGFTIQAGGSNLNSAGGTFTGYYTKIGNIVSIQGSFQIITKSAATGTLTIAGLPFSVAFPPAVYIGGLSDVAFADYPSARIDTGTTIDLFETTNAGTRTVLTNVDFLNNGGFQFSSTYRV
jgi:hypothetical protein